MSNDSRTAVSDSARLAALRRLNFLDTPPDEEFDRLARLASKLLDAPVALVTLVDEDRTFFKSYIGLPAPWSDWRVAPHSHSFCQHAIASSRRRGSVNQETVRHGGPGAQGERGAGRAG